MYSQPLTLILTLGLLQGSSPFCISAIFTRRAQNIYPWPNEDEELMQQSDLHWPNEQKTPVPESRCTSWWVNDLFGSPLRFSDCTWYLCRVHYWKHASRISFDSDYDSSSRSGYYGWKIKNSMISLSFRFFSIIGFYKILNIGPVLYSRPLFFILYVVMCAITPKLLSIPTLLPFWYPMAIFYVYKSVSFCKLVHLYHFFRFHM